MLDNGIRRQHAASFNGMRRHDLSAVEGSTAERSASTVPWLMQLRAFCAEASVVGLRYVANSSASVFRRSVWVLLLVVGAAFTAYQIQSRIVYYFSYPVNINIRVEHVREMRFPTVTICNENVVTLSGATSLGMTLTCNCT